MDTTSKAIDDILEHHGTKGMKWGVRRADKKWMKAQSKPAAASQLHNAARTHFLKHIDGINNKPHYKSAANKGHLLNPEHPTYARYHQEVSNLYADGLRQAAAARGTNPSGTKKIGVRRVPGIGNHYLYDVVLEDVSHANDSYRIIFEHDADGLISGVSLNQMIQGMNLTDDILEHHGTKGMKWGVRKSASQARASLRRRTGKAGPQEVTVKERKFPRKTLKTKGGEGHPAHPDAIRARTVGQVGKKSGFKALSNKDLQDYNQRLNLEQQASRLTFQDKSAGKRFVMSMLGKSAKGGIESGTKSALSSNYARKKMATGASALALAL